MIKGIYETHLFVQNLERSISFYQSVLDLELAFHDNERRAAFFWIGAPKQSMLGLWEKPANEIDVRHFAFECDASWVLNDAVKFLTSKGLATLDFMGNACSRPLVFAWMPAVSIYFKDPDGHELEFIGLLNGTPRPDKGVVSYQQCLEFNS